MSKFSNLTLLFATSVFSVCANAGGVDFNYGGMGCGSIVSMRETKQQPIQSELKDEYSAPRSSGGVVGQVLSFIPGVGILGAAAGELVGTLAITAVSSNAQSAERAKQAQSGDYDNVMAIEFRFDDGRVVNVPAIVKSGMRYSVGTRLNTMVSPKYGSFALGSNPVFGSAPAVGGSDYSTKCRIDDPKARKTVLDSVQNLVDESRIVKPSERRMVTLPAPVVDEVATR